MLIQQRLNIQPRPRRLGPTDGGGRRRGVGVLAAVGPLGFNSSEAVDWDAALNVKDVGDENTCEAGE